MCGGEITLQSRREIFGKARYNGSITAKFFSRLYHCGCIYFSAAGRQSIHYSGVDVKLRFEYITFFSLDLLYTPEPQGIAGISGYSFTFY
jgi:hypothetical protein